MLLGQKLHYRTKNPLYHHHHYYYFVLIIVLVVAVTGIVVIIVTGLYCLHPESGGLVF